MVMCTQHKVLYDIPHIEVSRLQEEEHRASLNIIIELMNELNQVSTYTLNCWDWALFLVLLIRMLSFSFSCAVARECLKVSLEPQEIVFVCEARVIRFIG